MKNRLGMQKKMDQNKGITLIALVITIVVLIILAGVSIGAITNNSGIIEQSKRAKIMTELSAVNESIELYEMEKGMDKSSYEDINDMILVTDRIAKSVEIEDTTRLVGVIQDFEALKVDNSLGNNGKKVSEDTISNIYEFDDAYIKDFTDGTLYYIKDKVLYSIKGNTTITEETKREGRPYLDLSSEDANDFTYSIIIAKASIGGIPELKVYNEFASEKLNGVDEVGLEKIFIDGANYWMYECYGNVDTPFTSIQEIFKWEYENGWLQEECTNLEEYCIANGESSIRDMLINWNYVCPKEYQEYYTEYQEKYQNLVVNITKPDGSISTIDLIYKNYIEYPVTQNGIYEFSVEYNGQIVKESIEINSIKNEEIEIAQDGENKYKIQTIEDLIALSVNTNRGYNYEGKTINLANDLDFSDDTCYKNPNDTETFGDYNNDGITEGIKKEVTTGSGFLPIGGKYISEINLRYDFKGIFDGNNYEIKNLYIDNPNTNNIGLFGINYGEIRNMIVSGKIEVNTEETDYSYKQVGGIVGYNYGNIKNVKNQVEFAIENFEGYIGGIAGYNDGGIIENSSNIQDMNFANIIYFGGICAYHVGEAEIKDCYNTGNINIATGSIIGGVVGNSNTINATINRCYNTGNINITEEVGLVGGIKGNSGNSGIVVNCYNLGDVSVKKVTSAGGIVGYHKNGLVGNCYNRGNVTVNGDSSKLLVGGIVGDQSYCRVVNCYNTGEINVTAATPQSPGIGGIVGIDYWALLKNVTNFGELILQIQSQIYVGGVAGTSYTSGVNVLENAKYLENTWTKGAGNRQDSSGVLETCTLDYISEMLDILNEEQTILGDYTLPENLKFNKWKIVTGVNDGYPIFEWQGGTNE